MFSQIFFCQLCAVPCKLDCIGNWTDWSNCGNCGSQSRTFEITQESTFFGLECEVDHGINETDDCNCNTKLFLERTKKLFHQNVWGLEFGVCFFYLLIAGYTPVIGVAT